MSAGLRLAACAVLLAGATVLAFFAGGYFPEPQAWAGLIAWLLVAFALAVQPRALPRQRSAWVALGGLAVLAAWTLLSILWAPIAGNAYHAGALAMLYLGALLAATLLLRAPAARRWVEPALAAGALVVIGYGVAGRLLPGVLHYARSVSAEGRLEQPLTYWNAMGELAALGFVLCAGIAGDRTRPGPVRTAAAAAAAPLGMGLYVSFSRGSLFACGAGLVALVVLAPRREQLWAAVRAVAFGALAAICAAPFHGVSGLAGSLSTREGQGAIVLVLLVVVAALAATAQGLSTRRERGGELELPRRAPLIAAGVITAGLALAILVGAHETSGTSPVLSGGATRLTSLQSNRYDYWSVALRAFASEPLHGVGAGGWSVDWLRWRTIDDFAQDAHSLELQTLAELGLVGLAALLAFFGGVAFAARRALRSVVPPAAAVAALVTYLAHSPLDWDWQMPAVTLVAIVLAGATLAAAEDAAGERQSSSAIRGASRRKIQTAKAQTAA
jgi:O-antigen ligase/polysaccharide polymerase Wzy-like membrane protein